MIINFYDEAKSYTALLLQQFSNLQLKINDTSTYNIPLVFSNPDRLRNKLTKPNKYRKPIMSLALLSDEPDLERSTNRLLKRKQIALDETTMNITYNDQATSFNFELWIMADTITSLTNIVSAISTTFHNKILYVDYISPLGETISTPIKIESFEYLIDNNEENEREQRTIEAKFQLKIEGVRHSQFQTTTGYIKEIDLYFDTYNKGIQKTIDEYAII